MRLVAMFVMLIALAGCADKATLLSRGDILTSPNMISPDSLTTKEDGTFSDADAQKLLNDTFKLYEIIQTANGSSWDTLVLEAKLSGVRLATKRDQFLDIYGKNYFAATSAPGVGYAALVLSTDLKFEYLTESPRWW